jgi:hypothetical protein
MRTLMAATAATEPNWADILTALGTVGLALTALLTIEITRRQRNAAEAARKTDRAEADARLEEERRAAEQRLRDERDFAERLRRHERQAASASLLLDVVAELQEVARNVVGLLNVGPQNLTPERRQTLQVLRGLQRAAHSTAATLGDAQVGERFRTLVRLAIAAAGDESASGNDQARARTEADLRNYAIFVRLSLQGLIDGQPIVDPGYPPYPNLARRSDVTPWHPQNVPSGWDDAAQTDPEHYRFHVIEPPPPGPS